MKKCPYCRKEIDNDSIFCIFCGKKVMKEEANNLAQVDNNRKEEVLVDSASSNTILPKAAEHESESLYGCYLVLMIFVLILMLSFCSS